MMAWWVFGADKLDIALAEHVARRMREGITEQQAKDEAAVIKLFLVSAEARQLRGEGK